MAGIDFFNPAAAPADGAGVDPFTYQRNLAMAQALSAKPGQVQQGQNVGGQYVPPSAAAYGNQLAGAAARGYRTDQVMEQKRAQSILDGGSPTETPMRQLGSWLNGMWGGGSNGG